MRILWLKSDLLLPLDKGGKLRTWHLMRHLAQRHDITYLAFVEPTESLDNIEGMREVASRVVTVPRTEAHKGSWRFYVDAARHLADPLPYAVAKYRSARFRSALDELLRDRRFDLVVCDFLVPAVNLPRSLPCRSVLFTHNVEAEIWRRHTETQPDPIRRWLYRTQHRRMLAFERRTLERFDAVLAVSDADRATFDTLYPGETRQPPFVVATGVDTTYFSPAPEQAAGPDAQDPHLVFTGSMDWLPNQDAMQFFCHDILPLIRAEEPRVRLSIVGRAPTPAVRKLAEQEGIEVTGSVDDVRPFVRQAPIYIVPLRIGGGTRLKIFEAMAMGKAVVSTTVGAEGLPVTNDEHVMIADDAASFAQTVLQLIRDPQRRRRLEAAARTLVVNCYDWSAVAGQLEEALLRVAESATPADSGPERVAPPVAPAGLAGERLSLASYPSLTKEP